MNIGNTGENHDSSMKILSSDSLEIIKQVT